MGILKNVIRSKMKPLNRLYLTIEHEGEEYLGALLFDDQFACQRTYKLRVTCPSRRDSEIEADAVISSLKLLYQLPVP